MVDNPDAMVIKGVPEHLRSDNGPEFVAKGLRKWLAGTGAKTAYIEPGSPWENSYCESDLYRPLNASLPPPASPRRQWFQSVLE